MQNGSGPTVPTYWVQRPLEISEEIINSFVDRQLAEEDSLAIIQRASRDKRLIREIRDRRKLKHLVDLAYAEPPAARRQNEYCSGHFRAWWPWR